MASIESVSNFVDLSLVADSLFRLLNQDNNSDIEKEFPNLSKNLSRSRDTAEYTLKSMCEQNEPGFHELYVISLGHYAVGLSVISRQATIPELASFKAPNLSGFICRPYRGLGLGRLSLESRINAVNERFDGQAWTSVNTKNIPSNHLVQSVGFILHSTINDRNIYTLNQK